MVAHGHGLGLKVGSYLNNCICMEGGDPPMGKHCTGATHYQEDVDYIIEAGAHARPSARWQELLVTCADQYADRCAAPPGRDLKASTASRLSEFCSLTGLRARAKITRSASCSRLAAPFNFRIRRRGAATVGRRTTSRCGPSSSIRPASPSGSSRATPSTRIMAHRRPGPTSPCGTQRPRAVTSPAQ